MLASHLSRPVSRTRIIHILQEKCIHIIYRYYRAIHIWVSESIRMPSVHMHAVCVCVCAKAGPLPLEPDLGFVSLVDGFRWKDPSFNVDCILIKLQVPPIQNLLWLFAAKCNEAAPQQNMYHTSKPSDDSLLNTFADPS